MLNAEAVRAAPEGGQWARVHVEGSGPLGLRKHVELAFSRPGKPTDNAHIDAFNGRLRQECPNQRRVAA
jgi:transposase InsO family protein